MTISCSMVPRSRSRTIAVDVSTTDRNSMITPISAGIMKCGALEVRVVPDLGAHLHGHHEHRRPGRVASSRSSMIPTDCRLAQLRRRGEGGLGDRRVRAVDDERDLRRPARRMASPYPGGMIMPTWASPAAISCSMLGVGPGLVPELEVVGGEVGVEQGAGLGATGPGPIRRAADCARRSGRRTRAAASIASGITNEVRPASAGRAGCGCLLADDREQARPHRPASRFRRPCGPARQRP